METFKQYMIDEMSGDMSAGFRTKRGEFNHGTANRAVQPVLSDAGRLLRRRDKMSAETLEIRSRELLARLVDLYDKMGGEATTLKGEIASKYTEIKKLLQNKDVSVGECVQMLEQICSLLHG